MVRDSTTTTVHAISCKQIYDPLVRFLGSRTYNQVTIMSTLPAERGIPFGQSWCKYRVRIRQRNRCTNNSYEQCTPVSSVILFFLSNYKHASSDSPLSTTLSSAILGLKQLSLEKIRQDAPFYYICDS